MAQSARQNQDFRGDVPLDKVFREFRGINTQPFRTSIQDDEFSWLENVMPIGFGNAKAVPACGSALNSIADTPNQAWHVTITAIGEALFLACTNGAIYQVLLNSPFTASKIANAGTLSGLATSWAAQWKADHILFIDPVKGYFAWDGTTFLSNGMVAYIDFSNAGFVAGTGYAVNDVLALAGGSPGSGATATVTAVSSGAILSASITNHGSGYTAAYLSTVTGGSGTGAKLYVQPLLGPTAGTSISVFAGRAWISNGRIVSYSAPDSYADFTVANAGGQFVFGDPTLHDTIQGSLSANNYLYFMGKTSFDALSNVTVNTSGATPITNFTKVNLESSIGSAIQTSVFAFYRDILFANNTGIYRLRGSTPEKISGQLDGIFPLIDFTKPFTGGQVMLYNILCAAWSFTYNDPILGAARPIQAIYFQNKWFITSQGDIAYVESGTVGTVQNLYAIVGQSIVQMYSNTNANISQTMQTKLWDLGSPIYTKETSRFGLLIVTPNGSTAVITVNVDSESSTRQITLQGAAILQFVNAVGVNLNFVGSGPIVWTVSGLISLFDTIEQSGAYIGLTIKSVQPQLQIIAAEFDYFKRTRWGANK